MDENTFLPSIMTHLEEDLHKIIVYTFDFDSLGFTQNVNVQNWEFRENLSAQLGWIPNRVKLSEVTDVRGLLSKRAVYVCTESRPTIDLHHAGMFTLFRDGIGTANILYWSIQVNWYRKTMIGYVLLSTTVWQATSRNQSPPGSLDNRESHGNCLFYFYGSAKYHDY